MPDSRPSNVDERATVLQYLIVCLYRWQEIMLGLAFNLLGLFTAPPDRIMTLRGLRRVPCETASISKQRPPFPNAEVRGELELNAGHRLLSLRRHTRPDAGGSCFGPRFIGALVVPINARRFESRGLLQEQDQQRWKQKVKHYCCTAMCIIDDWRVWARSRASAMTTTALLLFFFLLISLVCLLHSRQ